MFGYLETVFAVAMLMGGPLFGRFGDLFGARNALLIAMTSAFLTYGVLSMADSVFLLFLSRLMAFMMHAMHGKYKKKSTILADPLPTLVKGVLT